MTHHAVTIIAKEQAALLPVESPTALGPNEIRGKTVSSLISPGTELAWNYTGESFPNIPGYAAVFRAEELGANVTGIQGGDLLFCMGPHRSFQQVDASSVLPLPQGLLPEVAVLARLMGVSMTTLMTTRARPGDAVLVTGARPVGWLAAQVFAMSGYEVHLVEPDPARREMIQQAGLLMRPGLVGLHAQVPVEVPELVGSIALVVECSGHEQAVMDACQVVRKGGEVVLVGVPWRRNTDHLAHALLWRVFHNYILLRSGWEWELPFQAADFAPHSIFASFRVALQWLGEGRIAGEELITLVHPGAAQTVYQDLLHRRRSGLFTVFDWRG